MELAEQRASIDISFLRKELVAVKDERTLLEEKVKALNRDIVELRDIIDDLRQSEKLLTHQISQLKEERQAGGPRKQASYDQKEEPKVDYFDLHNIDQEHRLVFPKSQGIVTALIQNVNNTLDFNLQEIEDGKQHQKKLLKRMEMAFEHVYKKSVERGGRDRERRHRKKLTRKILKQHNLLEEEDVISVEFSMSNSSSPTHRKELTASHVTGPPGHGKRSSPASMKHHSQLPVLEVEELDPNVNPTELTNRLLEEREQYLSAQIDHHHDCESLASCDSPRSNQSRKRKKKPQPLVTKKTVLAFIERHASEAETPAKLDSILKKPTLTRNE